MDNQYRGFEVGLVEVRDFVKTIYLYEGGELKLDQDDHPVVDHYEPGKIATLSARASSADSLRHCGGTRLKVGAFIPIHVESDDDMLRDTSESLHGMLTRKVDAVWGMSTAEVLDSVAHINAGV